MIVVAESTMRKKRGDSIDLNELQELKERSPAKHWVNLLLVHMYHSVDHLTLRRSQGIPSLPLDDDLPLAELDFDKIINRLKVLSGLDPVTFREPRRGKVRLSIHSVWYRVDTVFTDTAADSQCEITMQRESPE